MVHGPLKLSTVFFSFLKLGCVAFGGPVAHLGCFQDEFVRKRQWISESAYADLVALCQFLPGPAGSQVGFAIGYRMGGVPEALLAWLGSQSICHRASWCWVPCPTGSDCGGFGPPVQHLRAPMLPWSVFFSLPSMTQSGQLR